MQQGFQGFEGFLLQGFQGKSEFEGVFTWGRLIKYQLQAKFFKFECIDSVFFFNFTRKLIQRVNSGHNSKILRNLNFCGLCLSLWHASIPLHCHSKLHRKRRFTRMSQAPLWWLFLRPDYYPPPIQLSLKEIDSHYGHLFLRRNFAQWITCNRGCN